jgi:hypothetical protein
MPQRMMKIAVYFMDEMFRFFVFIGGAILAFISPITELLWFAGFAISLDLLTGIWASKKRKEPFESKKLSRSWAKTILYPLGFIFSHWAESLAPEVPFIKGATYLLIVIEGKSLEENFSDILGFSMMRYIKVFVLKGRKGLIEEFNKDKNK